MMGEGNGEAGRLAHALSATLADRTGHARNGAISPFAGVVLMLWGAAGEGPSGSMSSDVLAADAKAAAEGTARDLVSDTATEVTEWSPGQVPKTPTGRGSVEPSARDPKRLFSRGEVKEGLEQQGGKCMQCGDELELPDAKGHHVERHANGGATTPDNLAVLCAECHFEVHSPWRPVRGVY
jgi:5-methylcytosine-specific restriction endonuclease McrA